MLQANSNWKSAFLTNRVSLAQNFRYKGSSPTYHSSCHKSRRLLYGIRILAVDYFIQSQCTRLTDRQILIARPRICFRSNTVETNCYHSTMLTTTHTASWESVVSIAMPQMLLNNRLQTATDSKTCRTWNMHARRCSYLEGTVCCPARSTVTITQIISKSGSSYTQT